MRFMNINIETYTGAKYMDKYTDKYTDKNMANNIGENNPIEKNNNLCIENPHNDLETLLRYGMEQAVWDRLLQSLDKDGNVKMENFIYDSKNNEYILIM